MTAFIPIGTSKYGSYLPIRNPNRWVPFFRQASINRSTTSFEANSTWSTIRKICGCSVMAAGWQDVHMPLGNGAWEAVGQGTFTWYDSGSKEGKIFEEDE